MKKITAFLILLVGNNIFASEPLKSISVLNYNEEGVDRLEFMDYKRYIISFPYRKTAAGVSVELSIEATVFDLPEKNFEEDGTVKIPDDWFEGEELKLKTEVVERKRQIELDYWIKCLSSIENNKQINIKKLEDYIKSFNNSNRSKKEFNNIKLSEILIKYLLDTKGRNASMLQALKELKENKPFTGVILLNELTEDQKEERSRRYLNSLGGIKAIAK